MKTVVSFNYVNYPSDIQLSKSRKPVFYKQNEKIPKKYLKCCEFKGGFLIDKETNQKVIKNKATLNKARYWKINFNDLWSGNVSRFTRAKTKRLLEEYYRTNDINVPYQLNGEIFVEFIFYTESKQDVDNKSFIYIKAFFDYLQKSGYFKDDNVISGYSVKAIKSDEQKLMINVSVN